MASGVYAGNAIKERRRNLRRRSFIGYRAKMDSRTKPKLFFKSFGFAAIAHSVQLLTKLDAIA